MSVFSARRAVAVVGAVVLSGVVFAVPASAADLPLAGTPECDAAVVGAPSVIAANLAVGAATDDFNTAVEGVEEATATRDEAQAAVDEAGLLVTAAQTKALAAAVKNLADANTVKGAADAALLQAQTTLTAAVGTATGSLCTDQTGDEPTATPVPTTTPAPTEQPDPDVVAARIAAQIDTLSCDDYRDELAAIRGTLLDTDTQTLLGTQRVGELLERLRLRNEAINSCVSPAPVPTSSVVVNGDVTVNPLDDDDSIATATQIRIVPQGSVSTGGA